jgi:light-regulated signal transduction histidine kinase (bacteriophytochrome)
MDEEALAALARAISHDLRAPLRAVDGYARMVLEDEGKRLTDEGRARLGQLLGAATQLSAQIDAVVEYLRVAVHPSGLATVDMNAVVEEALGKLRSEGRLAGVNVEVGALAPALGDREALRSLWAHLLDNAVKFSAKAQAPHIRVFCERRDGVDSWGVADNGAGFDQDHAAKLFGLFKRLHYVDEFPGVGAGLAICRRIVELHGGRIRAESVPGKGATLQFSLPGTAGADVKERVDRA